jgi:hypothetical protein
MGGHVSLMEFLFSDWWGFTTAKQLPGVDPDVSRCGVCKKKPLGLLDKPWETHIIRWYIRSMFGWSYIDVLWCMCRVDWSMMLYAYNGLRHEYILLPLVYAHTVHVWIHSTLWNIHMTLKQWCKFAGSLLVCPDKTRIYPHASPILYHINLDRRSNFFRSTDDCSIF